MQGPMGTGNWLVMLILAAIVVTPMWRICARTGHSPWLSLLMLLPLLNIGLLYFLAFSRWPAMHATAERSESAGEP